MYAEVERFLAEKLGGRYDAVMPEDVSKRLAELRVDISKVTYTKPSEVKVAKTLPQLKLALQEGTESWDVKLEVQGQTLPMKAERTYAKQDGRWTISEKISGPIGEISSQAIYDKTMKTVSRSLKQGPMSLSAEFADNSVQVVMGDQKQTLAVDGALLCDGPGMESIIQGLPLAEGYELGVLIADLTEMKVQPHLLKVEGNEVLEGKSLLKVTVSNVENPSAKTTLWLDPETKATLRSQQVLPQMGNAVLSKTLSPKK